MSRHRTEIEHEHALDDAAQEWLRVRIWLEGGQVTQFMVQYETTVAEERVPVVRYDTAHGRSHRDRLNRKGTRMGHPEFLPLDWTYAVALTYAEDDLRQNWQRYKSAFMSMSNER